MAQLNGTTSPEFLPVYRAFARNFAEHGEVGAAVHITVDGKTVVDLWGGDKSTPTEDAPEPEPWAADTLVCVFSCTKGATALCAHVLSSRGQLDFEAPVGDYWPRFARNGKEAATVRMLLDHSVGVPTWRTKLAKGDANDWDAMIAHCENEAPFWEPGTRNGYHMISFGWLVGEVVRQASGVSLGTFFANEVAGPTGADFFIGLPESEEHRVARVIPWIPDLDNPSDLTLAARERGSIPNLAIMNIGGFNPNSRASHAAEIGGGGGMASARGLAAIYRPLANGGANLVDADTLDRMGEVAVATEQDATLLLRSRFSLGFMKSMDNRGRRNKDKDSVLLGRQAFGHVGAGGSIGFADPECAMSFGYTMNRQGAGILLNERGQGLVDAAYECLGYRSNTPGVWVR